MYKKYSTRERLVAFAAALSITAVTAISCSSPDASTTAATAKITHRLTADYIEHALIPYVASFTGTVTDTMSDGSMKDRSVNYDEFCTAVTISPLGKMATVGHCLDTVRATRIMLGDEDIQQCVLKDGEPTTNGVEAYATPVGAVSSSIKHVKRIVTALPQDIPSPVIGKAVPLRVNDNEVIPFDNGDFAFMTLDSPYGNVQNLPFLQLAPAAPGNRDHVTFAGFAEAQIRMTAMDGFSGSAPLTLALQTAKISPVYNEGLLGGFTQLDTGPYLREASAALLAGGSGSPLLDDNDNIVSLGSCTSSDDSMSHPGTPSVYNDSSSNDLLYYNQNRSVSYGVDWRIMEEQFQQHGIANGPAASATPNGNVNPTDPTTTPGASTQPAPAATPSTTVAPSADTTSSGWDNYGPLVILLLATIAALLLFIMLDIRRQRREAGDRDRLFYAHIREQRSYEANREPVPPIVQNFSGYQPTQQQYRRTPRS